MKQRGIKRMKPNAIWLVIGIPATAVVMGIITLILALGQPDPGVEIDDLPLSKTSYRGAP